MSETPRNSIFGAAEGSSGRGTPESSLGIGFLRVRIVCDGIGCLPFGVSVRSRGSHGRRQYVCLIFILPITNKPPIDP